MPDQNIIANLPKGGYHDPPDERDFPIEAVIGFGVPTIDWTKSSGIPEPRNLDQDQSLSCGAHAWTYYHESITKKTGFSTRDVYATTRLAYGGQYTRDGGLQLTQEGQATTDEVPDPSYKTEANMSDKTGITLEKRLSDRERLSFSLGQKDIDTFAYAIATYYGVVFTLDGTNTGWANVSQPRPPKPGDSPIWGHILYAFDYHLHNGKKCIIAKSSWCKSGITTHHINEDYFASGYVYSAWTLIPKDTITMINTLTVALCNYGGNPTMVVKNLAGKWYLVATDPSLYPLVKNLLGLPDDLQLPSVSQAEVDANLGGKLKAGLSFIEN